MAVMVLLPLSLLLQVEHQLHLQLPAVVAVLLVDFQDLQEVLVAVVLH